jgi:histone deacetylase 11
MCLSSEALVSRDDKVVGMCRERGVPVVMLLSGGYQHSNAEVIADSLANLVSKWG